MVWRLVGCVLLAVGPALAAGEPLAASPHYALFPAAQTSGGGVAASPHYRLTSSTGGLGGFTNPDADVRLGHGFAAALNEPPLARPDTLSRAPGRPDKIHLTRLHLNDADPDADTVRLIRFDAVTREGGRVTFDNGWLLYEPPAGGAATDSFAYTLQDAAGHTAASTVFVLESSPGLEPSLNLLAVTLLPGGQRRLTFVGIVGRSYRLEWSDTLPATRWEPLAVVEADARGLIEWVDATEPPLPTRFYRTVGL